MKRAMIKTVLGVLAVGFSGSALLAYGASNPPQQGESVQIRPDGTKIIQDRDGSTITINPDGSKDITKPDGTSVHVNPDGSKTIRRPDGTTVEIKPGG